MNATMALPIAGLRRLRPDNMNRNNIYIYIYSKDNASEQNERPAYHVASKAQASKVNFIDVTALTVFRTKKENDLPPVRTGRAENKKLEDK